VPKKPDSNEDVDVGERTTVTKIAGGLITETIKGRGAQPSSGNKNSLDPNEFSPSSFEEDLEDPNKVLCLEIYNTDRAGEVHLIGQKLTIGRGVADLILHDPSVSSLHCTLRCQQGVVSLIDNSSANGTYVDGRRIKARTGW